MEENIEQRNASLISETGAEIKKDFSVLHEVKKEHADGACPGCKGLCCGKKKNENNAADETHAVS
jgi:hypothetical protein